MFLSLQWKTCLRQNCSLGSCAWEEDSDDNSRIKININYVFCFQNQNEVIGDLSFENVEKFRILGVTVTDTNDIREEIKRGINMGNAYYYSLEKI